MLVQELLELPSLTEKHRAKLEKLQGLNLSPAMQFSIARIAKEYQKTKKVEVDESSNGQKQKCSSFESVTLYELLDLVNNEEQKIVTDIFETFKQKQQKRIDNLSITIDNLSITDVKILHIIRVHDDYNRILPIVSKYFEEEALVKDPATIQQWRELVRETIEMQLGFFKEILTPEKPDRLNKFEQLLWDYNLAMIEDEQEDEQEEEKSISSNQNSTTKIDKRNAKIDWSKP
jgi:hypothetical protein